MRSIEVRMVKGIESLNPKLEIPAFLVAHTEILREPQVRVVVSRPVEEVPLGVSVGPQWFVASVQI